MVLRKIGRPSAHESKAATEDRSRDFRSGVWLTRPRPEIDRVGSAWLIRKFIDPKAKFIFGHKSL